MESVNGALFKKIKLAFLNLKKIETKILGVDNVELHRCAKPQCTIRKRHVTKFQVFSLKCVLLLNYLKKAEFKHFKKQARPPKHITPSHSLFVPHVTSPSLSIYSTRKAFWVCAKKVLDEQ